MTLLGGRLRQKLENLFADLLALLLLRRRQREQRHNVAGVVERAFLGLLFRWFIFETARVFVIRPRLVVLLLAQDLVIVIMELLVVDLDDLIAGLILDRHILQLDDVLLRNLLEQLVNLEDFSGSRHQCGNLLGDLLRVCRHYQVLVRQYLDETFLSLRV